MQQIFFSILPIFLITMLGAGSKKYWLTSDEFWRGLEKLSYFVLFPAVLFNYISTADISSTALITLVFGLIVSSIIVSAGMVWYQKQYDIDKIEFTSIFQGGIRYNSYIFFALGSALYGDKGLGIVSVISSYMIIFTNSISVLMFNAYIKPPANSAISRFDTLIGFISKFTANPLILASVAGFIFNYLELHMNIGLHNTLVSLSNAALAMGLMNVGAGLKFTFNENYINRIMISGVIKLCILPMIAFIILSMFGITGIPKAIGVLYSGLPCASTAYILSKQLGGDADLMASIITVTTIMSVFTLSIIMYFVR
jgi:malonate transporter